MNIPKITKLVQKAYPDVTRDTVEDYIAADWPEGKEHTSWIQSASHEEIADWIIACLRGTDA